MWGRGRLEGTVRIGYITPFGLGRLSGKPIEERAALVITATLSKIVQCD